MNTIGLIGGMSWESTAFYYRIMNQEAARLLGGLHSAPIILHSVDFAPIAEMQSAGEWDRAAELLASAARRLERGGAQVLGLCTNTMHFVAAEIAAAITIPFVHIADPTSRALVDAGFRQVGLLGTRFTLEKSFYANRLRLFDIDAGILDDGITELHRIIYEELCRGIVLNSSREIYIRAIERLAARGAEAVILGCTEIAMLVDAENSPLPVFDTTDIHARALVHAAIK